MHLTATISFGEHAWNPAISVIGPKWKIVEHLFKLARENDTEATESTTYTLADTSDDGYNPGLLIRSADDTGDRDFCVLAFIRPAVEL